MADPDHTLSTPFIVPMMYCRRCVTARALAPAEELGVVSRFCGVKLWSVTFVPPAAQIRISQSSSRMRSSAMPHKYYSRR